jgi:hypothetical protein
VLDDGAEPMGTRLCPIGFRPMVSAYDAEDVTEEDGGGRAFTARHGMRFSEVPEGSDVDWLFQKYVTVSPMRFDLNCEETLTAWRDATFKQQEAAPRA